MDPSLLLAILAPVLLLISVGVIVGLLWARGARRDAARTRHALDQTLTPALAEARAPSPVPSPVPSSADARQGREGREGREDDGVDPHELAAVRDDVRALQGRLDAQSERLAAQERRLEGLTAEVRALAEAPPAPPEPPAPEPEEAPPPFPSPREILRLYAREEGWEEVAILEDPADPDAFVVEARRGGMLHKGRAYVRPGGRVEADLVPAVRVFP